MGIAADEDTDGADESKPNQAQQPAQPKKVGPGARAGAERIVALLQSEEKVTEDVAKEAVRSVMAKRDWADLIKLPFQELVLEEARKWLTRAAVDEVQSTLL